MNQNLNNPNIYYFSMKKLLLALVMVLTTVSMSLAQVTTSALAGKVTDSQGEVIGATIQAVHTPSGTSYGTITNANGNYNIQGMRVGGPYKIKVSYIGYQSKIYEDVTLQLGEVYNLNVDLKESADMLEEVVVVGNTSKFSVEKTGATTNISRMQMSALPTINRSVSDIARLSPYANGMSFSGGDGRSTNFTIDGANFNNNFGLSDNLPGGGNPVSMDALDEIQVVIAPFDVRQTNFIGGGINAVTKSGTNEFKASVYTYQQNDNMRGARVNNQSVNVPASLDKHVYGATIGGPIIKDKLFFFAAYEMQDTPSTMTAWRARKDGEAADATNYISRTTVADMQTVKDFLANTYGYDAGSYTDFSGDESNIKFLGRIDWNITDEHHLAVRYNLTKNESWSAPNATSMDGGSRASNGRISKNSMAFSNNCYSMENNVNSFSLDLNSRLSDNMSNQLLATYTFIEDVRGTNSSMFPHVDILDGSGDNYMAFGKELFTHNNKVENKIITVKDEVTYHWGDHKFLGGLSYEHQYANNAYMRNGSGYYRFATLEDFLNGALPETFALTYGYNGETNPNAQVTFNQFAFYLQDEWKPMENFKLTAGLRFDMLTYDESDIMTNNAIKALDYDGKHIDTGVWPDAKVQVSPRIGFNWDVLGDKSLTVRGGTGLFAGRLPLVFFTNMPTNSGMIQKAVTISNGDANMAKVMNNGKIYTNVNDMIAALGQELAPTTITPEQGQLTSGICGTDTDFKMPQTWKTSIAVDYQLPVDFPLSVSAEYIYNETLQGVMLDNWNVRDQNDQTWERMAGADNRYVYSADSYVYGKNKNDAYVLTNTTKGYGYTANLTLKAEPIRNLQLMASYTHTESKVVSDMPGSSASSAWTNLYSVNGPDFTTPSRSRYVIPNRVIASVNWTNKSKKEGFDTHFTLFYTGSTTQNYCYMYNGDVNGDGIKNDMMYIPANDSEIQFKDDADRELFWAYVNNDDYLKDHKGEYAENYAFNNPWVHQFDLRIAQDFGIKVGGKMNKLTISLDFMNIGNLLNSKWGVDKIHGISDSYNCLKVLKVEKAATPTEAPVFSFIKNDYTLGKKDVWQYDAHYNQTWKLQLGIRYTFN